MSTAKAAPASVPASLIVSEDEKLNIEVWYENVSGLRERTMRTECVFLNLLEIVALGTLCESVREAEEEGEQGLEDGFRDMVDSVEPDGRRPLESDGELIADVERRWRERVAQLEANSTHRTDSESASQALLAFLRNDLFRCNERRQFDTNGAYSDPQLVACMPFVRVLHARIEQARRAIVDFEPCGSVNHGSERGVFAKMSVRSAKDVVLQQENGRLLKLWEPHLEDEIPMAVWNKYSHLTQDEDAQEEEDGDANGKQNENANADSNSADSKIQQRWQRARRAFGLGDSAEEAPLPPTPFYELPQAERLRLRDASAVRMLETFVNASLGALELKSACAVLWDFARSGRVCKDVWRVLQVHLERCVADASPESESRLVTGPKLAVILRKFIPLPANSEFRIFVKNARITCISQYDHLLYCPESILKRKEAVLRPVLQRFVEEKVLPWCCRGGSSSMESTESVETTSTKLLQTDSFVLDVAVAGINEKIEDNADIIDQLLDSVLIVEFNPFLRITSGCLFDWDVGADREILEGSGAQRGGNDVSPFEFRVVNEPLAEPVMELRRIAKCYRHRAMTMLDVLWPDL